MHAKQHDVLIVRTATESIGRLSSSAR